jgi:bifunctional non-homologous end joining protein LigD
MTTGCAFIPFCLPRLRSRPPTGEEWLHEATCGGTRIQLHKLGSAAAIYTHNGAEFTAHHVPIADALARLPTTSAILDGELVLGNVDARSAVLELSSRAANTEPIVVYCFDLMALNGRDLRAEPLLARKEKLAELLAHTNAEALCYSDLFTDPKRLLAACEKDGLEGIVSKHVNAPYRSGRSDWIKVTCTGWRAGNTTARRLSLSQAG